MFAVFKTGGKQYKVANGDVLLVEKLSADQGDKVRFNHILAMGGKDQAVGTPLIAGAYVDAEILSQTKGKKTINFVKRRRKHSSQRKKGHRQNVTVLKVLEIKSDEKISALNDIGFEIIGKVKADSNSKVISKTEVKKSSVASSGSKNKLVKKESASPDSIKSMDEKESNGPKKNKAEETKVKAKKSPKAVTKSPKKAEETIANAEKSPKAIIKATKKAEPKIK